MELQTQNFVGYDSIKVGDFLKYCRVCMSQSNFMENIFESKGGSIMEKLQSCSGIEISKEDGLPTHICNKCLSNLNIAHQFKETCIEADKTFRAVLLQQVKAEPDDLFENNFSELDDLTDAEDDIKLFEEQMKSEVEIKEENSEAPMKKERKFVRRNIKKKKKFKFTKLKCEPCNITFKNRAESLKHSQENHQENFICETCGKCLTSASKFYYHMKIHQPDKYKCTHCEYSTFRNTDLRKHLRIHIGIKLFQCHICSGSYYNISNLTAHIRKSHMKEKRFHCERCDKSFYDKTKLSRHLDSHNLIKRFECEFCHSWFTRRCYWKKHLLQHHGVDLPRLRPGRPRGGEREGLDRVPKELLKVLQETRPELCVESLQHRKQSLVVCNK